MRGWMKLFGLIALVGLLIPNMWEFKLIEKFSTKIGKTSKEKPE